MRRATLIGAWCAAFVPALAGCGGGEEKPEPSLRPVRLEVTAPADAAIVRGGTLDVRGRVSPAGAHVRVLGRPADVTGGTFIAVVALEHGRNIVDVAATAPGRRTTLAAFRVTRDERVSVPDLAGVGAADVDAADQPQAAAVPCSAELAQRAGRPRRGRIK